MLTCDHLARSLTEPPELSRFLDFWRREIEGPLHSVRVASSALIRPAELRYANGQFTLH